MAQETNNTMEVQYKVYGTNEPYFGHVVRVGEYDYTTVGGALEGDSVQLVTVNGEVDNLDIISEQMPPGQGMGTPNINNDDNQPPAVLTSRTENNNMGGGSY